MRFHYYGDPYQVGYYGDPYQMGYYGEPEVPGYPGYGAFANPVPVDAGYGYYGMVPPGYPYPDPAYAPAAPFGYVPPPAAYGYYGEEPYVPLSDYPPPVEGYGGEEQWAGYDGYQGYDDAESLPLSDDPGVDGYGYGDPEMNGYEGYVRAGPPSFNAGCPMPTNIAGIEADPATEHEFAGYMRPAEVSASCQQFTAPGGPDSAVPDTLRPLW